MTAPTQSDGMLFNGSGWFPAVQEFDVRAFKLASDPDDTLSFQRAADAAVAKKGGTLVIPNDGVQRVLSSQITIQAPSNGAQAYMNIDARGDFQHIKWAGPDNTSIFKSYGWKRSRIRGVNIRIAGNATGVIGFDVDHDAVRGSTSHLTFYDCHVSSDAVGVKTSCRGWRIGHGAGIEFSYLTWVNCSVNWAEGTDVSCTGFQPEHGNGLILNWIGCMTEGCLEGWTTTHSAGAAGSGNSSSWSIIGCGATSNTTDFVLQGEAYAIVGGRYETGKIFLNMNSGSTARQVTVQNVEIATYTPNEAGSQNVFQNSGGTLILDNVTLTRSGGAQHTALTVNLGSGSIPTNLIVRGGFYYAADPFFTNFAPTSAIVQAERAVQIDTNNIVVGRFKEYTVPRNVSTLTYSGTIATDAGIGERFKITATNGTAFTVSTPTNPATGATLTYDIKNSSGGAHGVITWGAGFLNGGAGTVGSGAFAGIANGKRRTISFYYDGTNWIEQYRTADQ